MKPHAHQGRDGAVVGLDVGGTKVLAGLFDSRDQLVHETYVPVAGADGPRLLDTLERLVADLAARSEEPVVAAGYGIPATIDQRTGTAVMSANLHLADVPIRDELERRLGIPAFVDNDANVAALAEQRKGAARGHQHVLMMTAGTGIGGGIVIDGQVFNGAIGAGGEIGHMSIEWDGRACSSLSCPNRGCLESYCSGTALARDVASFVEEHPDSPLGRAVADGAPARGETVVTLAREGDPDSVALLEQVGRWLGVGITNLVNIFNPEVVVVGGGLATAGEWLLPTARATLLERGMSPGRELARIVPAHFGPEAGMVGAALLARTGGTRRDVAEPAPA